MGVSTNVKPLLSKKSRQALITWWRTFKMAFCRLERIHKWRLSIKKDVPCSLGVIGYSSATWCTFTLVTPISYPPTERGSSFTNPVTETDDSWVSVCSKSKISSSTSPFTTTHWAIPLPSRRIRNHTFPIARLLYTQPSRVTSSPT